MGYPNQRIYDDTHEVKEHIHALSLCYPDDVSAPVTLTGAAGANTFGAWVQIIAGGTLSGPYDVHYVSLENASAVDTYRIEFSVGAGNDAFGTTGNVVFPAGVVDHSQLPVTTGRVDHTLALASEALFARVKTAGGGSDTVDISVVVHVY